jgi:hypothetical protein
MGDPVDAGLDEEGDRGVGDLGSTPIVRWRHRAIL